MPPTHSADPNIAVHTAALAVTPELASQLRRRWFYILPAVFVTYSLAYLDRANYGFGAAAGLAATLHITRQQSALLGALFFLGYFFFQVPGAAYARRTSAVRLIFYALLAWGALASLTGIIRTFWLLALDRLLLGVAESFVFPTLLILLTHWFTRSERSRTNTLLMLGNPGTVLWMSVVTGFIIHAFGWQMAFILEGIPAILWAFLWLALVRDAPRQAPWLSPAAKQQIERALDDEQTGLPHISSLKAAFFHSGVPLLCINYFLWSVGVYGCVLWLPTILRQGSTRSIQLTGLLGAVPFALAILLMLLNAHFSDRQRNRKPFVWPWLVLSGVAFLGSYATLPHGFWTSYAFLILAGAAMYAPYGPFFALIPDMLPRNVSGEVMALVNSFGALGASSESGLPGCSKRTLATLAPASSFSPPPLSSPAWCCCRCALHSLCPAESGSLQLSKIFQSSRCRRVTISPESSSKGAAALLDTAQNFYLIVLWVILSFTCLVLLNYFWRPARRRVHNDVIGWQISVVGTIYAVMVGFMLYAVWANFQTAETNVDNEANALVNLFRAADGLAPGPRDAIHIAAANYAHAVLNQEWPTMSSDRIPNASQTYIMQLWSTCTHAPADTFSQQTSLHQVMHELSNLAEHRRIRILESRSKMPSILWAVLVVGGMITIGSCCLIGSENTALHFSLIFALSLLISLALAAIGDIDRPFQGSVHVSPYAFVRAQETMLNPVGPYAD